METLGSVRSDIMPEQFLLQPVVQLPPLQTRGILPLLLPQQSRSNWAHSSKDGSGL